MGVCGGFGVELGEVYGDVDVRFWRWGREAQWLHVRLTDCMDAVLIDGETYRTDTTY